jgi:hypothetical protein
MGLRLLIELVPLLAAAAAVWALPRVAPRVGALPSRLLRRFAATPRQAILWAAVLSFAVCPIFSWVRPPSPHVHDEFSYLLGADTFAHGRLSNPTHPHWRHFETFHVIHTPTYQSKYPPGQALFLAAGQVLTGRPIAGVWLSMAAGAAAVCWMLLAFAPPRWALFGALLPAFRFGTLPLWDHDYWFAYWNTALWGGAVAMIGGALILGALPRLLRKPRAKHAATFALGLIVLANSRPFEGLVVAAVAALPMAWFFVARPHWRSAALRVVAPGAGVLALGALAMGYFDYRVTGDPLKMPYRVYHEQYDLIPLFSFQPLRAQKTYRYDLFQQYSDWTLPHYYGRSDGSGIFRGLSKMDLTDQLDFFWGLALWIPMLWLLGRPWDRWAAFAAAVIVFLVVASTFTVQPRLQPHYLAPAAPAFVMLAVAGVRRARAFRLAGRRVGRGLADAAIAVSLLSFTAACAVRAHMGPRYTTALGEYRPQITGRLEAVAGKDLVIVTYGPSHEMFEEWVYNGADLEGAPILWARDTGAESNGELIEYYAGRHIWRLFADENPPRLEPYEELP